MFGQNPKARPALGEPGRELEVVGAPFYTIQGEGPYAGVAAAFIRLAGCPLQCHFCDTDFTSNTNFISVYDLATKVEELKVPGFAGDLPLVVITGGEPTRQNLEPLISNLLLKGFRVQVETAGTYWQGCLAWMGVTVVVSPKTARIHPEVWARAKAFKYVISVDQGYDPEDGVPITNTQVARGMAPPTKLAAPRPGAAVYLSPMDEYDVVRNAANRSRVAQLCLQYGYRAGVQLHKMLGDLP